MGKKKGKGKGKATVDKSVYTQTVSLKQMLKGGLYTGPKADLATVIKLVWIVAKRFQVLIFSAATMKTNKSYLN